MGDTKYHYLYHGNMVALADAILNISSFIVSNDDSVMLVISYP